MNIYNNKVFSYLHERENVSAQKQLDVEGAAVADNDKYQAYVLRNTKTTFWFVVVILAVIAYSIIKRIIG